MYGPPLSRGDSLNSISIPGLAVAQRRDDGAFGRRIDMEIDDADAALLEDGNALLQRRFHVGRLQHRADADGALRLRELGDIGAWILQAQADPTVLGLAPARSRDSVLVQLIVEVGAIVVDQYQQRNAVPRRCPDRGRTHAEIAVAQHRDGVTPLIVERDSSADRQTRTRAEPAAAVLAQIGHAALDRPDVERPTAPERAEGDLVRS